MALWVCRQCTAAYAVGLTACPQCGSTDYEESHVAKITRTGVSWDPGHEPENAPGMTPPGDDEQASPAGAGTPEVTTDDTAAAENLAAASAAADELEATTADPPAAAGGPKRAPRAAPRKAAGS